MRNSSFGLGGLILGLLAFCSAAPQALADLPASGYSAQRVDAPAPASGARFGDGLVDAGDVNGGGKDDILVGQDRQGSGTGKVFVISGENGAVIRTIDPPDPNLGGNALGFGSYLGRIADVGGCPGFPGAAGSNCTASIGEIDTPDGVPDQLVTAPGFDLVGDDDTGRVYVIDGRTGAVLKRIDMPPGDSADQRAVLKTENLKAAESGSGAKPAFGRTVLSPAGQPPCAGNAGLGPCEYSMPSDLRVRVGDLSGDLLPDIVVGAPDYYETSSTNSDCAGVCRQSGRVYVYNGSELVGRSPGDPLASPLFTIRNPRAQADDPTEPTFAYPEHFGDALAPIGDIGKCTGSAGPPFCINDPSGSASNVPDQFPEFVAAGSRIDAAGMADVGQAYVFDGPTGRIIQVASHPEPQPTSMFGYSNYNQPAAGNLGGTPAHPDIYAPAVVQNVFFKGQGRGYVVNGNVKAEGDAYTLAVLDDPTPSKVGNFGTSSAGVGNLVGDPVKEIIVGATGPAFGPSISPNDEQPINDVVIYAPLTERVLQTIDDPDQQTGSGFGGALAPIGDLNGDGFLDFAVGAGGFDGTGTSNQGRVYILRSDNTPPPPPPPDGGGSTGPPGPEGPPGADGPPGAAAPTLLAGRNIEFDVSRERVRARARVKLGGDVEADERKDACEAQEKVVLQRRRPGVGRRFLEFDQVTTSRRGAFSLTIKPRRTYYYRALMYQTSDCVGVVSERQKVTVGGGGRSRSRR